MTALPQSAVVLGGGSVGVGIARALKSAGIHVVLVEPDGFAAERAEHFLKKSGAIVPVVSGAEGLATSLLVDALEEDTHADWPDLLQAAAADGLVATLFPDRQSRLAEFGKRAVGLAFAAPAHLRKLVEIAPGSGMAPRDLDVVEVLAKTMGKKSVILAAGGRPVAARLNLRLGAVADRLLMAGATPWEVDEAATAWGFDLGPFEAEDLVGLDVAYSVRRRCPAKRYSAPISDRAVSEGRLGTQIGWGWYRYPGGGGAVIDPLVEDLAREEARFAGVDVQHISPECIMRRLKLALADEAARIHASEGIPPSVLDLISVSGLGFPPDRGGIMTWASGTGWDAVARAVGELAEAEPDLWQAPDWRHILPGPV